MFKVINKGNNRVDVEIAGELDATQMRQALDELEITCIGIENGTMLYTVLDVEMPTFGAIMVELSRLPQLFSMVSRFDKVAVLADQDWIKTWSKIEGALIPGLEIRAFDRDEVVLAQGWLA